MLDNNREANNFCLDLMKQIPNISEVVVYDQCFTDSDYREGFTYIAHDKERAGFIKSRNELLKWFYKSDYDYCIWLDANSYYSKTCYNDLNTIIQNICDNNIQLPVILATLGIQISPERMAIKSQEDYRDKVYILKSEKGYLWFHGMFQKNFRKYDNQELYISEDCDVWKGLNEDVFFLTLIRRLYNVYLAPALIMTKKNSYRSSTWMSDKGSYDYPTVDMNEINKMVSNSIIENKYKSYKDITYNPVFSFERIQDDTLQYLKEFQSRKKEAGCKLF